MRVGIVGAGAVVRRGHLPVYGTMPEVEVVGITDLDQRLAREVSEEFKIPRYCASCEELLQDESIEMVDICTPTPSHLDMVKIAARKGRHVLLEKPLAASLGDALEIERVVAESGTKLCVVQNWRYFSSVTATKERISKGYLGKIVTIHGLGIQPFPSSWTLNTWHYHHGGTLYDFGPHLIDMILWLKDFQPIKKVYASGGDFSHGNMDFINYAVINMEFTDGSIATADISWVTAMMLKFTLDIYGTGGSIFLDVRNDALSETRGFPTPFDDAGFFMRKVCKLGTGLVKGTYFRGANLGYKPLIVGFVNSIDGRGEIPVPVGHALMTNAVLEAAEESIRRNKVVHLEEIMDARRSRR